MQWGLDGGVLQIKGLDRLRAPTAPRPSRPFAATRLRQCSELVDLWHRCRSLRSSLAHSARLFPETAGNFDRVNTGLPPPRTLITRAMHCTMMPTAEGDRELIADLAAERTRLRESEVVGVRGLAAAHETRLLGYITKVLTVAISTRRCDRENAAKPSSLSCTRI